MPNHSLILISDMIPVPHKTLIEELQAIPTFAGLPQEQLNWFIAHARIIEMEQGDKLFKKGDAADHMWIILQGKVQLLIEQGGQLMPVSSISKGDITGLLPFSQLKIAVGTGLATTQSTILAFHRNDFPELERVSPELIRRLVAVMTNRIREFTKTQGQREKLLSLGKLSAGLAHELNNPASAIARTTSELRKRMARLPGQVQQLALHELSAQQLAEATALIQAKAQQPSPVFSSLRQSELEDELINWMDENDVAESIYLAETFVKTGLNLADLESVATQVPQKALSDVLSWLESTLLTNLLLKEIEEASGRISQIVDSVKVYTHMDQASDRQWVNLHTGIDSTLSMLNHKLTSKGIQVIKDMEANLPQVRGIITELNQLWTNLIDNAIDAMNQGGRLEISTHKEGEFATVKITDNGYGIAPDIISKIFDPFFTTKEIGKGTGLGLDIVNRIVMNHSGTIKVESIPGRTQFTVNFPLEGE
jgi:signal transduction histidine kinase